MHRIRFVYRAEIVGGELRDEVGGSSDRAQWFGRNEVAAIDLVDVALLGTRDRVGVTRIPIKYGTLSWLLRLCLVPPRSAYVERDGDDIVVHMGWAFRARFRTDAVVATKRVWPKDQRRRARLARPLARERCDASRSSAWCSASRCVPTSWGSRSACGRCS